MKYAAILVIAIAALLGVEGLIPKHQKAFTSDLKKYAGGAFAAFTIASSVIASPIPADAAVGYQSSAFSSSTVVSEKVVRSGLYKDYEVDLVQEVDDARSTFKSAAETKSKKGKYVAILGVLIVGSFIIPMAQYFWYVRDDDSSEQFFAEEVPEPPQKKGWF